MAQQQDYMIIGGPSKFDLMASLFCEVQSQLTFRLQTVPRSSEDASRIGRDDNVRVVINGVQRTDDSGENWNIMGIVNRRHRGTPATFTGCYSSQTRTGRFLLNLP